MRYLAHAVLTCTVLVATATYPAVVFVDGGNMPGPGTGSEADPFRTLESAVASAAAGDEIRIRAGIYTPSVLPIVVDQDLTLIGSSNGPTIIQAAAAPWVAGDRVFAIETATVHMHRLTIRHGNGARVGGGIFVNGRLTLVDCTISHNRGQWGGGIFVEQPGNLELLNCTVSLNVAHHFGYKGGSGGGGIGAYRNWDQGGSIFIQSSTITRNIDEIGFGGVSAGGIYLWRSSAVLANSIVADNAGRQGGYWYADGYTSEGFESLGHNLDSDGTCALHWTLGDLPNVDPQLGPLAHNGGPTETCALIHGSPAVDAGDSELATAADQRGVPRPLDGDADGSARVDMGAYEYASPVADSDRDGLSDGVEIGTHGTDPTRVDTDGDAATDYEEVLADTDALDHNNVFRIVATEGGTVWFTSSANRVYSLLSCYDLMDGQWRGVTGQTGIRGSGGMDSLTDPLIVPRCTYRVRVEMP